MRFFYLRLYMMKYSVFFIFMTGIKIFSGDVVSNTDGIERILQILHEGRGGIQEFNKNIKYASIPNLVKDLHVKLILDFFEPKTVVGYSYFLDTFCSPIHSKDENHLIENRQNAIRSLINDSELKNEIEILLEQAALEEVLVAELFNNRNKVVNFLQKAPAVFTFMANDPIAQAGVQVIETVSAFSLLALACATTYWSCLDRCIDFSMKPIISIFQISATYTAAEIALSALYKTYINDLHQRELIHSLYRLYSIAEKIEELCKKYEIKNSFCASDIKDSLGIKLIQGLKHERYQKKEELDLVKTSAVRAFLNQIYENDQLLAPVFASIAEMDVYNTIANKMMKHADKENHFCFVQFIEQEKSFIDLIGFWHPLTKNKVIVNDLCENRNIILTGPNSSGKTTIIRAILKNILFAQTFGIAAASKFVLTHFDVIHSHFNISDDILNGQSFFMSGVNRAKEIIDKINILSPNEKLFFVLDELFMGTAVDIGEVYGYEFIKKVLNCPQLLFIYVTHFEILKKLANTDVNLINYKVDAPIKNKEGKLIYPHTLSIGQSISNIGVEVAQEVGLFD